MKSVEKKKQIRDSVESEPREEDLRVVQCEKCLDNGFLPRGAYCTCATGHSVRSLDEKLDRTFEAMKQVWFDE